MPTWENLENRFRSLESGLQYTRIDVQLGDSGEHWRLAGGVGPNLGRQFEAIAFMAGQKILTIDGTGESFKDLLREKNPIIRWYKALKNLGGGLGRLNYGHMLNDKQEKTGTIFFGSISAPALLSATLCLELAARFPEVQINPIPPMTISATGTQSRVNINSSDSSSNVVSKEHGKIFDKLRNLIAEKIPDSDRQALRDGADGMEAAVGTERFIDRYRSFMATANDHVTVLAPVLSALTQLL